MRLAYFEAQSGRPTSNGAGAGVGARPSCAARHQKSQTLFSFELMPRSSETNCEQMLKRSVIRQAVSYKTLQLAGLSFHLCREAGRISDMCCRLGSARWRNWHCWECYPSKPHCLAARLCMEQQCSVQHRPLQIRCCSISMCKQVQPKLRVKTQGRVRPSQITLPLPK